LGGELGDGHVGDAVRKVFVIQGVAVWLVSLPLQAAAVTDVRWTWVVAAGAAVWALGVVVESVGDAQLTAYRALPRDQRPHVLDTGLALLAAPELLRRCLRLVGHLAGRRPGYPAYAARTSMFVPWPPRSSR
jgi:steroid 5-alpha reductase family enzyme